MFLWFPWRRRTASRRDLPNRGLPEELLVSIFENLLTSVDTTVVYQTLVNVQLVCKQWRRLAKPFLYSRVEVADARSASALSTSLDNQWDSGTRLPIEVFVAGISQIGNLVSHAQFDTLLNHLSETRKLVIVHAGDDHQAGYLPPRLLQNLSQLVDVTILPSMASSISFAPHTIFHRLPEQVKFFQLPGRHDIHPAHYTPRFRLYGLTIQAYPSATFSWILTSSHVTLQMLTVATAQGLSTLASDYPNLRSLRILTSEGYGIVNESFAGFLRLEQLELRTLTREGSFLRTLPSCLKYIRLWSTGLVIALTQLLGQPTGKRPRALPALRTIVWDYWPNLDKGAQLPLLEICSKENIELRTYPRIGAFGERASEVSSFLQEATIDHPS